MTIFYALCLSMGLMQVFETYKIHIQKTEEVILDQAFSVMELVWLFVVLFVVINYSISFWGMLMTSVFISYHMFGWCISAYSIMQSEEEDSEEILIPDWYFKVCLIWASVFSLLAGLALYETIS